MGDLQPSLGGLAPPLQCNRLIDGDFDHPTNCERSAVWHILWNSDLDNGIVCDEHAEEARRRWVFYAIHPYRPDCSMPGARYDEDLNQCLVDPDEFGLPSFAAEAELVLTASGP